MLPRILGDLVGTIQDYFKIGKTGVRLKNNSGVLEVKNIGDTAYANAGAHTLEVHGGNATNKVTITAPAGLGGNVALTLPDSDGGTGEFLQTNGSGVLSWAASTANAETVMMEAFTQATSSPLTIGTPSANARVTRVAIHVSSAASAGAPTISVGVAGTVERDMAAAENDLKTAGLYIVEPMTDVTGTPAAMIATITPDGQTFTGTVYVWSAVAA